MPTHLTELLRGADISPDGKLSCLVPADWMQGRSVFGGLQVALALRAMRALVPSMPLRAIQATFVAPVGARVDVSCAVLRKGKSVTHVEARIVDGNATALLAVGIFGEGRPSPIAVRHVRSDVIPGDVTRFPFTKGITPSFIQHFDVRLLQGGLPFSGKGSTSGIYDVDLLDEGPTTEAHAVAIADFVPPLGLSYLTAPAPGSTVTWLLELVVDRFEAHPLRGWRIEAHLDAARDGYTSQSTSIWAPDGTTVAHSRQTMVVFG